MATEEDCKKAEDESADSAEDAEAAQPEASGGAGDPYRGSPPRTRSPRTTGARPKSRARTFRLQLGYMRFVYAAYMAGAMLVAFLVAKGGPRRSGTSSASGSPSSASRGTRPSTWSRASIGVARRALLLA